MMRARRPLLAGAALLLAATPALAETRTGPLGAPFCEQLASFRSLIGAMLRRDEAAAAPLADCTFLKAGVRLDVLRDLAELGPGARIVAVRVHGSGGEVDGYTLSNDVDDATPAQP